MSFRHAHSPALSVLAFLALAASLRAAPPSVDPAKITGPDACIACHKLEGAAWQEMKHYKTFDELHRRPEAKDIASKLDIANIKNEGICVTCHYTTQGAPGATKTIAGVSCELCHGVGTDWVKVHNDKTNPNHFADAEKLGFIPPTNLYRLASNCFQCHTIPNEKLVNTGGHQAGSPIELVAWTQGEVRHHFLNGKANAEATPERKRMLYLVGRIVDLEYSLRGVAEATENANYAKSMARRAQAAKAELKKIAELVPKDEIKAIAAAADGAALKLNNKEQLVAAAKAISDLGQKVSDTYKGADLAALDSLLPTAYQGTPFTAP